MLSRVFLGVVIRRVFRHALFLCFSLWDFFALGRVGVAFFLVVQDKFESYLGIRTVVGLNGFYRGIYVSKIKDTVGGSTSMFLVEVLAF